MKNLNLVRKIAWSYHMTTGIEYKELFSEACLGYCEALRLYKTESDVKLETYAWNTMDKQLAEFLWEQNRRVLRPNKIVTHASNKTPDPLDEIERLCLNLPADLLYMQSDSFHDFYEELPKLCKELVDVVLESVEEFPLKASPKQMRGIIVEQLKHRGWKHKKIWNSIREMKSKLQ